MARTRSPGQDSREGGIGRNPTCSCEMSCEIGAGFPCCRCSEFAGVAQLVEHYPSTLDVARSIRVARSIFISRLVSSVDRTAVF